MLVRHVIVWFSLDLVLQPIQSVTQIDTETQKSEAREQDPSLLRDGPYIPS